MRSFRPSFFVFLFAATVLSACDDGISPPAPVAGVWDVMEVNGQTLPVAFDGETLRGAHFTFATDGITTVQLLLRPAQGGEADDYIRTIRGPYSVEGSVVSVNTADSEGPMTWSGSADGDRLRLEDQRGTTWSLERRN